MTNSGRVYYNEPDPFASGFLRELMKDGLIPHGQIDTRPIQEVRPADLRGIIQAHFFAGVGGWALAFRIAGIPDDFAAWSGSCPCPPFSVAGKRKVCPRCASEDLVPCPSRTGFFLCCACGEAWMADDRHLWPEWWRLLRDARPDCPVFGEQVASEAGRAWLAVVRSTLAILDYGAWGADLCSAGVGKDNIRQRLYWMADPNNQEVGRRINNRSGKGAGAGPGEPQQRPARLRASAGGLDDAPDARSQGRRHNTGQHAHQRHAVASGHLVGCSPPRIFAACADGKYRPIPADKKGQPEPRLFPLVDLGSVRNRVGILRAAGNLIDPFLAAEWIAACADVRGWKLRR